VKIEAKSSTENLNVRLSRSRSASVTRSSVSRPYASLTLVQKFSALKLAKYFSLITLAISFMSVTELASAASNQLGGDPQPTGRLSKLHQQSHPVWQRLQVEADNSNSQGEDGLRRALISLITDGTANTQTTRNAKNRGLAYYHSDWTQNDSFFASWYQTPSATAHHSDVATNFGLFRANQWVVDYPHGNQLEADYSNTLLVSGGLGSAHEARGQTAFESGDSYLYHVGSTGGRTGPSPGPESLPELIHEWTRSYLYLHNSDDSDSVIVFDRLNNSDPLTELSASEFNLLDSETQADIQAANSKHHWILHLQDANPYTNHNKISWFSRNGEPVHLHSYLSSRFKSTISRDRTPRIATESNPDELAYQIRLIPQQKSGWQTFLNIVHSGSDASTSAVNADSGENAQGVLVDTGSDSVLAVFNGDPGRLPFKSNGTPVAIQPSHLQSSPDQNRLHKLNRLRYFKSGFELELDSQSPTEVYVADLDPDRQWLVMVDGSQQSLVPARSGLAQFDINFPGLHRIKIFQDNTLQIVSAFTKTAAKSTTSISTSIDINATKSHPQSVAAQVAAGDIIIDNRDTANTSSTGLWKISSRPNPWKTDSVYSSKTATFRWRPNLPADGKYKVYAWWTSHSKRSTNVPYTIQHSAGKAKVTVNQRNNSQGGRWNHLGTFQFNAASAYVEVARISGVVSADAIRFEPVSRTNEIVIDNRDQANTSSTGQWKVSAGPNPWGANSEYSSNKATFRWTPTIASNGSHKVYAWWTYHNKRATKAPYVIRHTGGTDTVTVNQRNSSLGGRWNLLGTYPFKPGSAAYIELRRVTGVVNADAVRLVTTGSTPPPPPPPGPTHWWKKKIATAPLHTKSANQISKLAQLGGFGLGRMQIDFGIKVVHASAGAPKLPVAANKFGFYLPDSEPIGTKIPVPAGASIEGSNSMTCNIDNNDCHYIVKQGNTLYETYQSTRSGGKLQTRILAIWDLNKNYPASGRGDHCTSADAAGFPIEPLLWNADEIKNALNKNPSGGGDLGHAIRFILPNSRMASDSSLGGVNGRLYVRPASHAGAPSGPKNSVAYGARLRLRANFPTAGYNPATRVLINTMKRYGIALSDGGNIALTATSDQYTTTKWTDLGINSRVFDRTSGARPIDIRDFEVVDTGPRIGETYNCVRNF